MNDTLEKTTPPTVATHRNGSAPVMSPADELTNAFLSVGRLLLAQYPDRFVEAAKTLDDAAAPKPDPRHKFRGSMSDPLGLEILEAIRRERDPWLAIQGDLDNQWGRELSAAILREREKVSATELNDEENE